MQRRDCSRSKAFTIVELMVVISIMASLSSIVITSVVDSRYRGKIAAGYLFSSSNYHAFGAADMIGSWSFDESSGNPLDASQNNFALTPFMGSVSRSANTPIGRGSSWDTTVGGWFIYNMFSPPQNFKGYTMSAWLYLKTIPSSDAVIATIQSSTTLKVPIMIYYDSQFGITCFDQNFSSGPAGLKVYGGALQKDHWYHVTCSLNGSTGNMAMYLYGNKVAEATGSAVSEYSFDRITVGWDWGAQIGGALFDGYLDDLAIYSKPIN